MYIGQWNNSVHVCSLILCDVQLSAYSVNCIFVHDTSTVCVVSKMIGIDVHESVFPD